MKKEVAIFCIAYIIASIIRGSVLLFTGFSFNIFFDEFNLLSLAIDLLIWILSYVGVRFIFIKLARKAV